MDDPVPERWNELLEGRRQWLAADTGRESLIRFAVDVVDPLRAMEDSRMVRIEVRGGLYGGTRLEYEVRVVEIAGWVAALSREGGQSGNWKRRLA